MDFWDEGEADVIASPHFARLTGLGSDSRGWGSSRVALALTNPHLTNLRVIDFNNADYNGFEAALGIATAKHLTNLLVLDLTGNCIEDEGLEALAKAKHLSSLRALRLGEDAGDSTNDLTADGIAALARSKCLTSLTQLILDGNDVGDEGAERLLKAPWIGQLTELDVAFTGLTERGLLALTRSRKLTNLRRLSVSSLRVSERVGQAFLQSKWFPNLKELHLYSGAEDELPSEETRAALAERFPPTVMSEASFVPSRVCWEDKVAWRFQMLVYTPPNETDDCEVV